MKARLSSVSFFKKACEPSPENIQIFECAFPNYACFPSRVSKGDHRFAIAVHCTTPLLLPKCGIRDRCGLPTAAIVHVPKTSVHENDFPSCRKHEIRLTRQISAMKPKAIADSMQQRAYGFLRTRVLSFDTRHAPAALFRSQRVSHRPPQPKKLLTRFARTLVSFVSHSQITRDSQPATFSAWMFLVSRV